MVSNQDGNIDLTQFNIDDQMRAFAQIEQMRMDAEFARRFAGEEFQRAVAAGNPVAPVVPAPPPQPTTSRATRRLSTPAECTICQEVPVDPRGCRECLNIIGCKECCLNWAKQSAQPSCPLCRYKWNRSKPGLLMVQTIQWRLRARNMQRALPPQ
ncbi:unnamed protein product [Caenorhabditis brenneri]